MERVDARAFISLSFVILLGIGGSQPSAKRSYLPISEDVPHVLCQTCQKGVRAAYKLVSGLRESSSKKLSEDTILEEIEKLCDPQKEMGYWIRGLDIQDVNGQIRVVEQNGKGACQRECRTIAKACEESINEVDTDLAEALYRGKLTLSQTINQVCHEQTDACKKVVAYKSRKLDESFVEMSEKDLEMERLMDKMNSVPGMPGMEMYSRDDMERMKEELGEDVTKDEDSPRTPDTWYSMFWQKLNNLLTWFTKLFYDPSSTTSTHSNEEL